MARIDYYDSTTDTNYSWTNSSSTTDSRTSHWFDTTNSTIWIIKRMLVPVPEVWNKKDVLAFIDLVNQETKTGWIVEMYIEGDVLITDPHIEVRSMKQFMPLLKWRASSIDLKKIKEFFRDHPVEE